MRQPPSVRYLPTPKPPRAQFCGALTCDWDRRTGAGFYAAGLWKSSRVAKVPAEDLFGGLLDQVTGSCMDTPHCGHTKNR